MELSRRQALTSVAAVAAAPLLISQPASADRFFPSSKTRSDCGCVKHTMSLSVGFWSCGGCAMVHERDPKGRQKSSTVGLAKAEVMRGDIGPVLADANVLASAVVEPRT